MGTQKTHEQFLESLAKKNVEVEVQEKYVNSATAIQCKCKRCGHIWNIRPNNLLNGYGCPVCGIEKRAKTQTKNETRLIQELNEINPNIEFRGPYHGARKPAACHCKVCGNDWNAAPTNLLKGRGCPKCAKKIRADKKRISQEDFEKIVHQYHPNIEIQEDYKGSAYNIKLRCNICGYEWETKGSHLLGGTGCPRCAGNGTYSQAEFVDKLKLINPYVEVLGNYTRSAQPVECKCLRCGGIWKATPNNLLNGKGCPSCSHAATSFVEQVILGVFQTLLGASSVVSRDKSYIGKELDIMIPELNLAIEPGSWRWHRDKLKEDEIKRIDCKKAGIRLITVYYDYNDEGQQPFDEDCICVPGSFGHEKEQDELRIFINNLLDICAISTGLSEEDWSRIVDHAYLNSRRMATDAFKQRMLEINQGIEILGEYTGARNRIECKCLTCGTVWKPFANNIMRGTGCPVCSKGGRK